MILFTYYTGKQDNQPSKKMKDNDKWIKASVIGTIWASFEIVFGSFLHNLRIPFSGTLLTGIGLIVLISVSYLWNEKGLFWRAGLITAILKTLSPSAVIFGPMIAIFAESVLLEFSTLLLGRTMAGYLAGAVLAVSWNLVQRIINLIIFYGFHIVELYTHLVQMAEKEMQVHFQTIWMPVLIFSGVYILLGIFYGFLGIKIGRKLRNEQDLSRPGRSSSTLSSGQNQQRVNFDYSLTWLFVDLILLVGSFLLLSFSHWQIWSIAIILIGTIWSIRYKRAFRQIASPKFWVYFVFITMLVALVFNGDSTTGERVLIGLQMNFRAAAIIMGFSVLGTELYHPKIRRFFQRNSFNNLSIALELSFNSLPTTVANLPNAQSFFRKPMTLFFQILSQAEERLTEMKRQKRVHPRIFILSGERGQGKTWYIREIINLLRQEEITVSGIYSDRVMNEDTTIGYDVVDIKSGEREVFLRLTGEPQFEQIGRYYIHPNGLRMGINSLQVTSPHCDLVIIDEIGQLELKDRGWSDSLNQLLHRNQRHLLLTTRTRYADELISRLNGADILVYDLSAYSPEAIGYSVLSHIRT